MASRTVPIWSVLRFRNERRSEMKTKKEFKAAAITKWMELNARISVRLDQNAEEFIAWYDENVPREEPGQEVLAEIKTLREDLKLGWIFGGGNGKWGIMEYDDEGIAIFANYNFPELRIILRERVKPKPVTKDAVTAAVERIRLDCGDSACDEDLDILEQFAKELSCNET